MTTRHVVVITLTDMQMLNYDAVLDVFYIHPHTHTYTHTHTPGRLGHMAKWFSKMI